MPIGDFDILGFSRMRSELEKLADERIERPKKEASPNIHTERRATLGPFWEGNEDIRQSVVYYAQHNGPNYKH